MDIEWVFLACLILWAAMVLEPVPDENEVPDGSSHGPD